MLTLFEKINSLNHQIEVENLNIHSIQEELERIIDLGKQNTKLKIITHFLSTLEVLARNYKYENSETLSDIKTLIKKSLSLLLSMVDEKISNQEGAGQIQALLYEIRIYLVEKCGDNPFISDEKLLLQFAHDLKSNIENIEALFLDTILVNQEHQYYTTMRYYLNKILDSTLFLGIKSIKEVTQEFIVFIEKEYQCHKFTRINNDPTFINTINYYKKMYITALENYQQLDIIKQKFCADDYQNILKELKNSIVVPIPSNQKEQSDSVIESSDLSNLLTQEEISALMQDNVLEFVSFDNEQTEESHLLTQELNTEKEEFVTHATKDYLSIVKEQIKTDNHSPIKPIIDFPQEEVLIKYMGRLFQKQEQLYTEFSDETKTLLVDDLNEINTLTDNIKQLLFKNYYISIQDLLGKDLRDLIHTEVKKLGKKIKLGIQGENSEICTRMSEFIKQIVFTLVRNSLNYSLESLNRRIAIEKSETGWLLISFNDSGEFFDIYVKDDGKGIISENMNIPTLENQVSEVGGTFSIDAVENEYLKIHIQIPMKKILYNCLAIQLGDTNVLIPSKYIDRVIENKELMIALRDKQCIGQVNLSTLLNLNKNPINMMLVCEFHGKKIVFGIDKVLYNIEALVEKVDIPLIPCADSVTILKDGSLGFILNEKKLEFLATKTILNREKITHIL